MNDDQEHPATSISEEEYAPFAEHYDMAFQLTYRTDMEQHSVR